MTNILKLIISNVAEDTVKNRYTAVKKPQYSNAMTKAEHRQDFELTNDSPYLAQRGKPWVSLWVLWKTFAVLESHRTVASLKMLL